MRKTRFSVFFLLAAVVAMLSCGGDNSMPGGRSKAEYERLKAVADSVDMQSPRARELVDSALTHTSDSLIYYDYFIELTHIAAISYVTPCFSGGDFFGGGFRGTTDFTFPMGFGLISNSL